MGTDGLLRVVAAAAAAFGVFALVTGSTLSAAGAGASSVAAAVLAGRGRVRTTTPTRATEGVLAEPQIDIRESGETSARTPAPEVEPAQVSVSDPLSSGSPQLYDGEYLAAVLRGRIAVARRALRPLSVVHVQVIADGTQGAPVPAHLIAAAAEATLRESDIVGRRDDGIYVVVLEDTGEDGAVWTAERLRRHIAGTIGPQRFQAGVASYPNHGLDADTVDASAARALEAAREWDRDRIEVALH